MIDKILIEVLCPSVSRRWDFRIPTRMKLSDVKEQMIADIQLYEGSDIIFSNPESVFLMNSDGEVLNGEFTAEESGIDSGDVIMII